MRTAQQFSPRYPKCSHDESSYFRAAVAAVALAMTSVLQFTICLFLRSPRTFVGTWQSTFTGYITRLRGYYRFPAEFSWYYFDRGSNQFLPTNLAKVCTGKVETKTRLCRLRKF